MSEAKEFPSVSDFVTKVPLYREFDGESNSSEIHEVIYFEGTIDFPCVECGATSVFFAPKKNFITPSDNQLITKTFHCSRDTDHRIILVFFRHNEVFQKIGQTPSIADLSEPNLRQYRALLGEKGFRELTRAVGLASHGVGIGAYVYLRRRFEFLIEKYHAVASDEEESWDEEAYSKARMDEKIKILESYLPKFLVENRMIYSILSKGLHELSEVECLDIFPALKAGIEVVLDEELIRLRREKKIEYASKEIARIHGKLKGDKSDTGADSS